MVLEHPEVEIEAMTREDRPEFMTAPVEVVTRALIGVLAQAAAAALAEHVGEEHVFIITRRLEPDHIPVSYTHLDVYKRPGLCW